MPADKTVSPGQQERAGPEQSPRIGVYVCHCDTNIAGMVGVEAVAEHAADLEGVVVTRRYPYLCSDPGQDLIKQDVRELGLNRVVVSLVLAIDAGDDLSDGVPRSQPEPLSVPDGQHLF